MARKTQSASVDRRQPLSKVGSHAFQLDARSLAILNGARIREDDLREAGGAYSLGEVRTLMHGLSRRAIDRRVQAGAMLAVLGPGKRRSYPALQFLPDGSVVGGIDAVRGALRTSNPWIMLNFLVQPDVRLSGEKPIDLLKGGKIELVVEAARRVGEQGA